MFRPSRRTGTDRFALLDPLRGLAACWVFAFHLPRQPAWDTTWPTIAAVFDLGHYGVPLFFAISGFVITGAARAAVGRDGAVRLFLARRLRRIYPPFWASILVVCAVPFVIEALSWLKTGTFVPPSPAHLNYGFLSFDAWAWLRHATLTQAFVAVPEATNLQYKFTGLNAVYWTLAIEVQFYLMMTLAVAAGRYLYAVLAAVTVLSLLVVSLADWMTIGVFLPYWPMFAVGAGIYVLFDFGVRPAQLPDRYRTTIGASVLLLLVAAVVVAARLDYRPSDWHIAGVLALGLLSVDALDSAYERWLRNGGAAMRWTLGLAAVLGAMSYSIYLLHGRLQFLSFQLVRQVVPAGIPQDVLVLVLTVALCYPFYLMVERPLVAPRRGKPQPLAAPAPVGTEG